MFVDLKVYFNDKPEEVLEVLGAIGEEVELDEDVFYYFDSEREIINHNRNHNADFTVVDYSIHS